MTRYHATRSRLVFALSLRASAKLKKSPPRSIWMKPITVRIGRGFWVAFIAMISGTSRSVPPAEICTAVSLRLVLSGEPDALRRWFLHTHTHTACAFVFICLCDCQWELGSECQRADDLLKRFISSVISPPRAQQRWWEQKTRQCAGVIHQSGCGVFTEISLFLSFFFFFYHCSYRAPDPGTRPCVAQCLHLWISRMRTTTASDRAVCPLHPETHFRGIYPGTSAPSAKSTAARCWIRLREPCSGSQVRATGCCGVFPFFLQIPPPLDISQLAA